MKNLVILILGLLVSTQSLGITLNGFNLDNTSVSSEFILVGGPPRDEIPSIDRPKFVSADQIRILNDKSRVIGISSDKTAKAYPISILNWHEIVNDRLDNKPVLITYCPLCGTGVVFSARIRGQATEFGVSGLLYNSDVLLYDRKTESLWSQILAEAISGPLKGEKLEMLPSEHTTWGAWKKKHPKTLVLSTDTGFLRDYQRDPYDGYATSGVVWFPLSGENRRFHPKERVLGVEIDGKFKAYPFVELFKSPSSFTDSFNNQIIRVVFDKESESGVIYDAKNQVIPIIQAYWFAWSAFHKETEVYLVREK